MTTLDLACLGLLLLSAATGAFVGALAQLASAGAAAAGLAGARFVAPHLVPLVRGRVPAFAAHPVASVVAFIACAGVAVLALRVLGAALGDHRGTLGRVDRGLGALVGGAKAAVVLWVVLSALALWGRPLRFGPVDLDPTGSDLVGFAREHSALGFGRPNPPAPAGVPGRRPPRRVSATQDLSNNALGYYEALPKRADRLRNLDGASEVAQPLDESRMLPKRSAVKSPPGESRRCSRGHAAA